jgi:hypothetical protein
VEAWKGDFLFLEKENQLLKKTHMGATGATAEEQEDARAGSSPQKRRPQSGELPLFLGALFSASPLFFPLSLSHLTSVLPARPKSAMARVEKGLEYKKSSDGDRPVLSRPASGVWLELVGHKHHV